MLNKSVITILGTTITASLCCITPVLAALAGTSSLASSFSWLAPYRNYLVIFTVLILIYAWYNKLKKVKTIECCENKGFFKGTIFLTIVTVFTTLMLTFPLWGNKVFDNVPAAKDCMTGICNMTAATKANKTQSALPTLGTYANTKSCSTDACPTPKKNDAAQTTKIDDLPVLKYMSDEKAHPTEHGQVVCGGTGFKVLDDMLANARRTVPEMPPVVLKRMIDNEEEFVLIDVREAIQRAEGSIYADEAIEIPRTNLEFEILNKITDKSTTMVLYDRMGARSLLAAESLKKLGYINVYNLNSGLKGWVRAEYPYDNGLGTVKKVVDAE